MKRLKFIMFFILTISFGIAKAQSKYNECKSYIYDYVKRMAAISLPKDKEVYYLEMKLISVFNLSTKLSPTTSNIIVERSADFFYYDCELMSFFMDKNYSYVVLKTPKKIIKGKSNMSVEKENLNNTIKMQDTLMETSKVVKCEQANVNGDQVKIVYMLPMKSITDKYHIKMVCYKYSLTKEMLSEVIIYYEENQKIVQQKTIYEIVDFNYKKPVAKNAYSKIFTSTGSLQKKYKNFEFIDNSKNN